MSAINDMFCSSASDSYLLLTSGDFITRDLDHAFDDTVDEGPAPAIPYHLVLRKAFNPNPALEFRMYSFAVSQREINYFAFLFELWPSLLDKIQQLLRNYVLPNFPDRSFVFDVYIPPPSSGLWKGRSRSLQIHRNKI